MKKLLLLSALILIVWTLSMEGIESLQPGKNSAEKMKKRDSYSWVAKPVVWNMNAWAVYKDMFTNPIFRDGYMGIVLGTMLGICFYFLVFLLLLLFATIFGHIYFEASGNQNALLLQIINMQTVINNMNTINIISGL